MSKDFKPVKVAIANPVPYGTEQVTEVNFARPMTGGDLRGLEIHTMKWDDLAVLAGRLTGFPPSIIESMQGDDFMEVCGVAMDFLKGSRKTGPK